MMLTLGESLSNLITVELMYRLSFRSYMLKE